MGWGEAWRQEVTAEGIVAGEREDGEKMPERTVKEDKSETKTREMDLNGLRDCSEFKLSSKLPEESRRCLGP